MKITRQNNFYITTENGIITEVHDILANVIFRLGDKVERYNSTFIIKEFTLQNQGKYCAPRAHSDTHNEKYLSVDGKHVTIEKLIKL